MQAAPLALVFAVALATGPCTEGSSTPRDAGPDVSTACDDLAARYVSTAVDLGYCTSASDCWAYAADCAITTHAGAPACFLLLNQEANRTQFADMSLAWQALGCPTEESCGTCGTAPALDCQGGACVAVE